MRTRIVLADDHGLVRAGLRELLESNPQLNIVGEAATAAEAYQLVQRLRPDLLLTDIAMPGNGLSLTARIKKDFPTVRVIVLSMHANEEYILMALGQGGVGADGYVLKEDTSNELEDAISAVMADISYLSPALSSHMLKYMQRNPAPPLTDELTERQRQVLKLLAEGKTTAEIALALHIEESTVKVHRAAIKQRLNLKSTRDLVLYALRMGLVTPD